MLRPWLEIATTEVSMLLKNLEESVPPSFMWYIKKQESKWEPWLYDMTAETCEDNDQNGLWNTLWNLVKPCETFNMFNNDEVSNCMKYEECGILPTVFCNCQCHMTWLRRSSKPCRLCPSVQVGRQDGHSYLVRSRPHAKCHQNVTWMTQHDSWHSESQRITAMLPAASATPRGLPVTVAESAKFLLGSGAKAPCFAETAMCCNVLQCTAMYCNTDPVLSRSNVQKEN